MRSAVVVTVINVWPGSTREWESHFIQHIGLHQRLDAAATKPYSPAGTFQPVGSRPVIFN